jgi:hypothetical protein
MRIQVIAMSKRKAFAAKLKINPNPKRRFSPARLRKALLEAQAAGLRVRSARTEEDGSILLDFFDDEPAVAGQS